MLRDSTTDKQSGPSIGALADMHGNPNAFGVIGLAGLLACALALRSLIRDGCLNSFMAIRSLKALLDPDVRPASSLR